MKPRLRSLQIILLAIGLLVPSLVQAQLNDALWIETLSMTSNTDSFASGPDDQAVPQSYTESISGSSFLMDGKVSFAVGAPNATCSLEALYNNGLTVLGGTANCQMVFEFTVRETSPPPVLVSSVPVNVQVLGDVSVDGDLSFFASAQSSVSLVGQITGPIDSWQVAVDNSLGSDSDAFGASGQYDLAPDEVVVGTMIATVAIGAEVLQDNTSATAEASVDPVIEVVDDTIPGTSDRYGQHYEIEFSNGYWALLESPVRETTWGKIKRLYVN